MSDYQIFFKGPMVRAILEGRKTQTRRVIPGRVLNKLVLEDHPSFRLDALSISPYGQPGDRLWVREAWAVSDAFGEVADAVEYRADGATLAWDGDKLFQRDSGCAPYPGPWKPSIHMPRWACRLLLEVTAVRVERLNDLSEEDAKAEGCKGGHGAIPGYGYSATAREHFNHIWQQLYGPKSLADNPWVWVVEFKKAQEGGAV